MIGVSRSGERDLALTASGKLVATLRLGLPGVAEASDDPDEVVVTRDGSIVTRVRLFEDADATHLIVTVENTGADDIALPTVGLAVEPDAEATGWSWTADIDGFVVLTGGVGRLVMQLRQGFGGPRPTGRSSASSRAGCSS